MIQGHHVPGCGQAHHFEDFYRYFFNRPMHATFNVRASARITDYAAPAIEGQHPEWPDRRSTFWLVRINGLYAYAYRHSKTRQPPELWELISKQRLPRSFREGTLELEVLEPWQPDEIERFCDLHWKNAWHQSFPWSPQKCDSQMLWNAMKDRVDWAGSKVVDIGCNFGFHSIQAAKAGAIVTGYDTDPRCTDIAQNINDHIEMTDVDFRQPRPVGAWDTFLYLSVHHQGDPTYRELEPAIRNLKTHAIDLFVELILPPMFGQGLSEDAIDRIVGGSPLLRYKHPVRGIRKLYHWSRP